MVKHIDTTEFENILADREGSYVVDFFATWCGPCKSLAPVFESVSEKFPDIPFCKVDVDENMEAAQAMRVSGVPTIVFISRGQEAARSVGYIDEDELSEFVEENRA